MNCNTLNAPILLGLLLVGCGGQAPRPTQMSAPRETPRAAEAGGERTPEPAPDPSAGPGDDDRSMAYIRWRLESRLETSQVAYLGLPASWPPTDATLIFFIYRSEPLPTSRITHRIEGPVAVARVDARDATIRIEEILTLPLIVERPARPEAAKQRRAAAETLLLEVVAGRTAPAAARAELRRRYCELLDDGAVGQDLRARAPEFLAWLACGPFSHVGRPQIITAE